MRKYRMGLIIFLTLSIMAFGVLSVSAQENQQQYQAVFTINSPTYSVNGQANTMDVAPFAENGRTYVPLRFIGYAVGVAEKDIVWDGDKKTAALVMNGITEEFTVDSVKYYVNDEEKTMDVAPLARDGRIFLPARYVAQEFGFEVGWESANSMVTLTGELSALVDEDEQADPDADGIDGSSDDDSSVVGDVYGE